MMQRVGEHPVPVGPLAVRWLAHEVEEPRAGVTGRARLRLENAGSAPWRSRGTEGVHIAYHWLDPLGNPIVWDGIRTPFPHAVEPGATVELEVPVVAPRPPGTYRLAFDLVEELRFWFEEVGSVPLELPVDVRPRIAERRLRVVVRGGQSPETETALAALEEPVVDEAAVAVAHLVPGACSTRTPRATPRSAARSRSRAVVSAGASRPGRRAAGGTRASGTRCSSPRSSTGSSRRPISTCPRSPATTRSSRGERLSDFDGDPVVRAAEDERADGQRDRGGDQCVDRVPRSGQLAVEEDG
jgi:hypothetical protein